MKNSTNIWTVYRHISPSGKSYIGITSRKLCYRFGKNGNGYKKNTLFWKAIQKYGWKAFTHEVLETNLSESEAYSKEKYYINKYNSYTPNGYNLSLGGESGSFGYHHTEETKSLISQASKVGGFKGHKHTNESNEKNRQAHLGSKLPHNTEWNKNISNALKGKKRSPECCARMSEMRKTSNFRHTEETKRQISETCKKKRIYDVLFTEEARKHYREARCVKIVQIDADDNVINSFDSVTDCAKFFNVSIALISNMINGKCKNKFNLRRISDEQ